MDKRVALGGFGFVFKEFFGVVVVLVGSVSEVVDVVEIRRFRGEGGLVGAKRFAEPLLFQ